MFIVYFLICYICLQSIPTIEADDVGEESYLSLTTVEAGGEETEDDEDTLTEPLDKQSQEELINRLMTDGMSFSEVCLEEKNSILQWKSLKEKWHKYVICVGCLLMCCNV